jgi:tRNA modification GTPase
MPATVCACATACGGEAALVRLSGPAAVAIALASGLELGEPWHPRAQEWRLGPGSCPCVAALAPRGRSYTGEDLVEILLPGSADLVALALARLESSGANAAEPGAFTRQALANGRLRLDQAEAVLSLTAARDAAQAARALARLRGELGEDLGRMREALIGLRARIEAGLDFAEEEGVVAVPPAELSRVLGAMRERLGRWLSASRGTEGAPSVVLCGPANAGKSALFRVLTGAPALVSEVAGTTRDCLEEAVVIAGRQVRLIDTAGWMEPRDELERAAQLAAERAMASADLVLACSAPDAPLPDDAPLPPGRALVVATKADLGAEADPRAAVSASAISEPGTAALLALIAERLGALGQAEPRQGRLLARCDQALARLESHAGADELVAEDLRAVADGLGELIGATTSEEVLAAIFSRFCIGK